MFSFGSYSGVPRQMCCSMLWMGPREGSVQFICRSVQFCCPVASLRLQVALYVTFSLSMWQISVTGYPPQAILMKVVRLFVWESKNSLLLPQLQNKPASLTPTVFFPLSHCVWHWGAAQPHLFILNIQLKTGNKVDQLRTDAEVCISSRKRSCVNHKNKEQCKSANSMKMAITWTM